MFVVMLVQDFDFEPAPNQPIRLPFPITVEKGKMVGFLPIYNTREDALTDFPNAKIVEVRKSNGR